MACRLGALDKRPGVLPMDIGETFRRALAKLVMRAAGEQAKTACVNLQLCAGLEAGIEWATHAVGQRRVERTRTRRVEEEGEEDVAAVVQEEDGGEVAGQFNNLIIEPPWAAYCALIACRLVALDKRPGVLPMGIGETLRRALDKLVMRAAGEQAKTACGNLQLCAGLEASIEGAPWDRGGLRGRGRGE